MLLVASLEMDELFELCLLHGLKNVKDSELPMPVSGFYSAHVQSCRPGGVFMDIKKSSYKKVRSLVDDIVRRYLLAQKVFFVARDIFRFRNC